MAVQVLAGPVVPHRRSGISVAGGDLHVAQISASIETGREQCSNHAEYLSRSRAPGGYSRVGDYGWISPTAEQGQVRSLHRPAAATGARHVRGVAARRRAAWLTGELAAAGTCVSGARMHQVQRERLVARSGRVRRPMTRRPGGSLAVAIPAGRRSSGSAMMHPMQPGIWMQRDASRRNDDARRATKSAASSLHQIQAHHEVPGHRSRAAARRAEGTAGPHAAAQAARVHANCRMMQQMQLRSLAWS